MPELIRLPDGQEAVVTVWPSGEFQVWGALDATYAHDEANPGYSAPLSGILDAARELGLAPATASPETAVGAWEQVTTDPENQPHQFKGA